jgi:hypothetical protein
MVDANAQAVGRLHACFGRTADPGTTNFYGEFDVAGVTFKAVGECRTTRTNYPQEGLTTLRCFSELRDLPTGYVGGQLTTNSLTSRRPNGELTDPPGYVQSSIVTVRLWKRR